jgi:hypothetical protein
VIKRNPAKKARVPMKRGTKMKKSTSNPGNPWADVAVSPEIFLC